MLTNEFGFEQLITTVCQKKYNLDSLVDNGWYVRESDDIEITSQGLTHILNFIKTNSNNIIQDLGKCLCGLLAHKAYLRNAEENKFDDLIDIISLHHHELLKDLESFPQLSNKESFCYSPSSSLNLICFIESLIHSHFNNNGSWGIGYLMLYLGLTKPIDFAEWFDRTNRKDLQILYLSHLLSFWNTEKFVSRQFLSTNNPLLRLIALLKEYPVLKINITVEKTINIQDLNEKIYSINQEENLCIYLLYLQKNYWNKDIPNTTLNAFKNSDFKSALNKDTFTDFYHLLQPISHWKLLIDQLDSHNAKSDLIHALVNLVFEKIDTITGAPNKMDIDNILLLEKIAEDYTNIDILSTLDTYFEKQAKKSFLPYSYFRNHSQWISSCCKCLVLLKTLYNIAYQKTPPQLIHSWKEDYLIIKGNYQYYSNELEVLEEETLRYINDLPCGPGNFSE